MAEPIIVSAGGGKDFKPAPAGVHHAVCCDVIDLGLVKVKYGDEPERMVPMLRVCWQLIDELMDDGKPYLVMKRYTKSLGEKSILRKDLESWRGRTFTEDELKGFDVNKLVGANCMINTLHVNKAGTIYSNVNAVMPLAKGMVKQPVHPSYVRVADRAAQPMPR